MNARLLAILLAAAVPATAATAATALAAPKKPAKAARQAAPVSTLDPAMATKLWDLLDRATRSGDILARGDAFYGLALLKIEGKDPSAALLDALKDPQGKVRLGAARGLLALGNGAWREPMIRALGDAMVSLEDEVLPALASLPLADQAALIVEGLNGKLIANKMRVAQGLLRAGGPLLPEVIRQALAKGGDAAAVMKQNIATLTPEQALLLYPQVLPAADAELKGIILANVPRLPAGADLPWLAPLLKDPDPAVARKAALILGAQGNHDAVAVLLPMASAEQGPTQLSALRAIASSAQLADLPRLDAFLDPVNQVPSPVVAEVFGAYAHAGARTQLEPHVRRALQSTDGPLRAAGVRWIGFIDGTAALPRLAEYLTDGNADVRRNAATAVGELKVSEGLPLLERGLRDTDDAVRLAIVQALAMIPDNGVVNVVQFLVSDMNRDIKLAAIEVLAGVKSIETVDTLRVALMDSDPDVRKAALRAIILTDVTQGRAAFNGARGWLQPGDLTALARQLGKDFAPYLELALDAEAQSLRVEALDAAALLGAEAQATLLEQVAEKTRFPEMKLAALERLVPLRGAAVVPRLSALAATQDTDVNLRIRALQLIGLIGATGAKAGEEALKAALEDPSEQARVAAAVSLIRLNTVQPG